MNTMSTTTPTSSPSMRSPWHSPVPYLFGGLAAMLGLIAFALLILACSYWRLSGRLGNNSEESSERDLEAGASDKKAKIQMQFEEKVLVIMAGEKTPTFLATPVSIRGSSFKSSCDGEEVVDVKVDGEGEGKATEGQLGSINRDENLS